MSRLVSGFVDSVKRHADRPALCIEDRRWRYRQLGQGAARIAGAIVETGLSQHRLVGLLAAESKTAYAGVPAILAAGRGVVPVDPSHPTTRIGGVVDHSGVDTLVVGMEALDRLEQLLERVGRPMAVIVPEAQTLRGIRRRYPRHRFRLGPDLPEPTLPPTAVSSPGETAFLLYTSGTGGRPKAVPISHRNAEHYLEAIARRFPLEPTDRCSQTFPLSFDLAIHDLFSTWHAGATLVVWPRSKRSDAARFIRRHWLTRWFSVPTDAMAMKRLGALEPGRFPALETSMFCGEPLSKELADAWAKAAPNSSVINLYGPTEATCAISAHRYGGDDGDDSRPLVPVGRLFEDHRAVVVDRSDRPVDPGRRGELLVSGPQVVEGYRRDEEAARRNFVELDDRPGRWFRTGDLVEKDQAGRLHFVRRLDDQIKLRGYHVELNEVDRVLRSACGHEMAACVGWPRDDAGVHGLVGVVACDDEPIDTRGLLASCRRHLPNPMVPDRIVGLRRLPTNDRGKLDRTEIQRLLRRREV